MNIILFFILAFITVYFSIKLSIYTDNLSKGSKVNSLLIGGVLLAGITSLPEFVTCLSSVFIGNYPLATGDILGGNLFNIFIICVFDLIYFKKMIFNKTGCVFKVFILLGIDYLFLFLYMGNIFSISLYNIGFPTLVILALYIYYLFTLKKDSSLNNKNICKIEHVGIKIFFTSCSMVISSLLLTVVVNNIAISYSFFSSSVIGAILLGVITSLPEVITFYTLIYINNYDLALMDIIGSNLFNLSVLAISDVVSFDFSLYDFCDNSCFIILILCFITNFIGFLQNIRNKSFNYFTYIIPSLIVVCLYMFFWVINFIF